MGIFMNMNFSNYAKLYKC